MNASPRSFGPYLIAVVLASATVGSPGMVQAHITKVQITAIETPTFGGYSWPGVGQYEKIVGKAFGEVDPLDPKNAGIVDIERAPRNAIGKVEYSFDFYILKPIDLSKGAHKVMYEPPNRGGTTCATIARTPSVQDPPLVAARCRPVHGPL